MPKQRHDTHISSSPHSPIPLRPSSSAPNITASLERTVSNIVGSDYQTILNNPDIVHDIPFRRESTELTSSMDALTAFEDGMSFMTFAARSLAQDEFSKCFEPKERSSYPMSLLYPWWACGFVIRYFVLFPTRLFLLFGAHILFVILLIIAEALELIALKRWVFQSSSRVFLFSYGAWVRYHGDKPRLRSPHVFVSNHTSFTDYFLISACGSPNATVAQVHGGLFGLLQRYLLCLNGSLSFQRNEQRDRVAVVKKIKEHVRKGLDTSLFYPPLVIFPEGTCVNNEYTVLFHKGAFELDCVVCPVAIKYDKRWLDPYWNTREQSFTQHIAYLMTRWLMVVDVWWLEPQKRSTSVSNINNAEPESPIEFANRIKAQISRQAGLKNLSWDGYMKNVVKSNDLQKLRTKTQARYAHYLRHKNVRLSAEDLLTKGTQQLVKEQDHINPLPKFFRSMSPPDPNILSNPIFPPWLPESTIVDIQNELIVTSCLNPSTDIVSTSPGQLILEIERDTSMSLLKQMARKVDSRRIEILQAWRYYTQRLRHLSSSLLRRNDNGDEGNLDTDNVVTQKRIENSTWRMTRIKRK